MPEGFKMGSAFVEVNTEDNTREGRESIGSSMQKWAGGLAIGATISKGITDNLDIGAGTAKLAGQLNLTKDVSQSAGKIAGEVYRDNFGQSIPEVTAAIGTIGQSLVDLNTVSDQQLKTITEGVLGLTSTFDVDLNATVEATRALITNRLAPDAQSAMDLMTRAFQSGGNASGDLLETITEYSPYFHNLGLDGPTALGLLSQGLKAGARDTDYIADAFKEFGIRAIDTTAATATAFQDLGFNAQEMAAKIAAGGSGAQEGLLQVLRALQNMKDPVAQNLAGVALFGTQWEDTLRQILPGMDLTEAALTDVKGATERMNTASADSAAGGIESVKRQMEGWVQSMTNAEGPLGAISSWALGAGSMFLPIAGQIGMVVAAMSMMNFAAIGTAASVVGSWIAMAAASIANAIVMAASWLLAFWPIALIVVAVAGLAALIIMNWDTIRNKTVEIWNAIWKFVSDLITTIVDWVKARVQNIVDAWNWLAALPGKVRDWLDGVRRGAVEVLTNLVNWFKSLPGKLLDALGDLGRLLYNAGKKILQGLWDGLKNMWNSVKDWVGNVGGWISDLKGPIEVDAVILTPHGNAFMSGLKDGLEAGFETEVKPTVAGMAADIANTPMPMPAVAPRSTFGAVGGDGASAPGDPRDGAIIIENLTVTFPGSLNAMPKTDLRAAAVFLRDEIRNVERGQVTA
jgi:hypothetical protein